MKPATDQTISIDELRRTFGEIKKELPFKSFILTDRGKPIARLSALPEAKKSRMMTVAGSFKGTELEGDDIWEDVLKKRSKQADIHL